MLSHLLYIQLLVENPETLTVKVEGVERTAIVYRAKSDLKHYPTVFVFHGFTGNAKQAAASYRVHLEWPEANVVYPQGLNVRLLNQEAPGWQIAPGLQEDRDLKLFDALADLLKKEYQSDSGRVYSCGMSNGAIFTYVLAAKRPDALAAIGAVGGFAPPAFKGTKPLPTIIVHGQADRLIGMSAAESARDAAIANNGAKKSDRPWAEGYELFKGKDGNDVVWRAHPGGHTWPAGTSQSLVKFFQETKKSRS